MKVIKKQIKDCEFTNGKPTKVLDLEYSHRWEKWRILVKDYDDNHYKKTLKELRKEVRKAYENQKTLQAHNKARLS